MKTHSPHPQPIALTIAGSDSGGGAGVQADLKVFNALGVHGATAITCLTCQNPREVGAVQAARPDIVRGQIEAVLDALPPAAIKTGMLYSASIIRAATNLLKTRQRIPVIVDPVMVATSGARLLQPAAIRVLQQELLPLANLVTPNLDEAAILANMKIPSPEDLRRAAHSIYDRFGCAVLVKGGHLKGLKEAVDIYWDGNLELLLSAPFIRGVHTHGTGCTYSAAITGFVAKGLTLAAAVKESKKYISRAICNSRKAGHHWTLGYGRARSSPGNGK